MRTPSFVLLGALALSFTGCGADAAAPSLPPPTNNMDDGGDGGTSINPDACVFGEETSQACDCPNAQTGVQYCYDTNQWGTCACPFDPGEDTNPDDQPCKPGYYTGSFEGEYWTGALDFGFGSLFPVYVKATGDGSRPGLALTIEEDLSDLGGEFVEYKVGDGCIVGTARALEGLAGDHPFIAVMKGTLDCNTGDFIGEINGYYKLFGMDDVTFSFKGPITSKYLPEDPPQLAGGVWDVKEVQSMAANGPGGNGIWGVTYTSAESGELAEECKALLAQQDGTTPPADTTTP